ncbi:MAG TPA: aspartate ammonia-lyase [bacterium]|mgnify:CR=1 FL=1|nr:aspartate ammonia-lyase [bacterium]
MKSINRNESDILGEMAIPRESLCGIHTQRALNNFPVTGNPVHPGLVRAFGTVKLACAQTNRVLGFWEKSPAKADAIEKACGEMADGLLTEHIVVDEMQGGAGTSTNMNVNEVLANRALDIMGREHGEYSVVSPTDDINLNQSTNDTFPTALKLAAIQMLHILEGRIVSLQEAFQQKEKEFADIVKVGRTQMQDAVLTTLGREMSAYADVLSRDRWRVYKCEERLRVVNLGGTAIGTGLGAPRKYIFGVVDKLRELTGIGFARAENLIDATQNADVFVEVSGILKALASSLIKISTDLRFMSSGPEAGIGELKLPRLQAGSSIMPGKINSVIPEAVTQSAMLMMGYDTVIAHACSSGNLELNPFLPLVAKCLLDSCGLLSASCEILRKNCVEGLEADREKCRQHVESSTATATALIPLLGYEKTSAIVKKAIETGMSIRETVIKDKIIDEHQFDQLISPEAVCRLGAPALIETDSEKG